MAWKKKDKKQQSAPPAFENIEGLLEEPTAAPADEAAEPVAPPKEAAAPAEKAKKPKKERTRRVHSSDSVEKSALMANVAQASPYTVLLAISLVAVLIAIVYLTLEFGTYGFDHKAKEVKQQAAAPASIRLFDPIRAEIA